MKSSGNVEATFNRQNFNKLKQTYFTRPVYPTYLWMLLLLVVAVGVLVVGEGKLQQVKARRKWADRQQLKVTEAALTVAYV